MEKTLVIQAETARSSSGGAELDSLPVKDQSRYKFLRSIGFGGMKSVLLVEDRDTSREIAMAIMPDFRERPVADLERFVKEAKLTARLEHPNIVPVHDIGKDRNGSPYYTMKYLKGASLSVILRRLRKGDEEAAREYTLDRLLLVYLRICNAVRFAHSKSVCHLDLKPDNVNLGDFGEVLVLDWGLARELKEDGSVTDPEDGMAKGTPGYMAPELFSKGMAFPAGIPADIYALGGILYSILALVSPFAGLPAKEVLQRAGKGLLPPPTMVAPTWWKVPPALEAICLKAMSFRPEERYRSVEELRREIKAFQAGFAPEAEHASRFRRTGLFLKRHYLTVLITFLLFLVLTLALLALRYRFLWRSE